MTVSKKLGKRGGITIPQQLRHAAGIMPGAPLDIESVPGSILITKHVPSCCICSSVEDVVKVQDIEICAICAASLADEARAKLEVSKTNE
jgi:transcriptional pleiotropic regulator of transition state genes